MTGRAPERGSGPASLVGREPEQRLFASLLDAARAGRGGVVLVGGEPGIGKTRLVHGLLDAAAGVAAVGLGTCRAGSSPPWWAWRRALTDAVQRHPEPAVVDALRVLDASASERSGDYGDPRLDQFERVSSALTRLTRPLVLVLDDLQWADPATLELLAHLPSDISRTPVLIAGTFRSDEVPAAHPLRALLARRAGDVHLLSLVGLRPEELPDLVATFGVDPDTTMSAAELHAATAGNPLFVRELVRLAPTPGTATLPETARAVIDQRLQRLPASARLVLDAAAVGGQSGTLEELAAVVARPVADVLDVVGDLQTHGLMVPPSAEPGGWEFSHALIPQSAIASLPARRRAELHRRWADTLAGAPGSPPAVLYEHLLRAGPLADLGQLASAAAAAGHEALDVLAYADAARFLRHADRLADHPAGSPSATPSATDFDPIGRTELLLALGRAELRCGRRDAAAGAFARASTLARETGRAEHLALAALGLGAGPSGFEIVPFEHSQLDLLDDALAVLPDEDSALRSRLLARLSVAKTFIESTATRRDLAERAVAMARRLDDPAALAYALGVLCDAIAGPDDVERRLELAGEMVALSSRSHDREVELLARRLRIVAHLERGDEASFVADIDGFARVADRLQMPLARWYVPLWRGTRAMMAGDFAAAERCHEQAAELGREAASYNAEVLSLVAAADRWYLEGRFHDSYTAMGELFRVHPELDRLPGTEVVMAFYALLAGDAGAAERWYRSRGGPDPDDVEMDSEWLTTTVVMGAAAAALDDVDTATAMYERLLPHADRFVVDAIAAGFFGSCHGWLAVIAERLGRRAEAATHRGQGIAANRRAGAHLLADQLERSGRPWAAVAAGTAARTRPSPEPAAAHDNVVLWRGDHWSLTYAGVTVLAKDSKGLGDLAVLLARPDREVAAIDLVGIAGGKATGRGPAGDVLDEPARRALRDRIVELQDDVEDAEAANDIGRQARAQAELDELVTALAAATGLGGRSRSMGSDLERARKAASARIADAIGRLERLHPDLGRHLRHSVRTGTFCAYRPEQPTTWRVHSRP